MTRTFDPRTPAKHSGSPLQKSRTVASLTGMITFLLVAVLSGCEQIITAVEESGNEFAVAEVQLTPAELTLEVGEKRQLEASARNTSGELISTVASDYSWSSSDESISTVSSTGELTARGEGTVTVTAALDGKSAEAEVTVAAAGTDGEAEDDPPVSRVEVTPDALEVGVGANVQLQAAAFDSEGEEISTVRSDFTWESSNSSVASVTGTGEVTGVSEGSATISARLDGHSGEASVTVSTGGNDPPSDSGDWDHVVANTLVTGNLVVAAGERWLIGPDVRVEGHVLVEGSGTVLAMRPGSSLKFIGADPSSFVGGGMDFESQDNSNDIGLWVWNGGSLDISGTPKAAWNRTGSDPSWEPDDEYWIAPTAVGDFAPRRWFPGDPIPRVPIPDDAREIANGIDWLPSDWITNGMPAEIVNVTRDIVIEGPGHIHIHSQEPQRIEYVTLRNLGAHDKLGRYALHHHHGNEGARGSVWRGIAAVDSPWRAFVPHLSHGIEMYDNVSVNSGRQALWWDEGDNTHDLIVDGFVGLGTSEGAGVVTLGSGQGGRMLNVTVAGGGGRRGNGFDWDTKDAHRADSRAVWQFDRGNVAHNNAGFGVRFWFNDAWPHHVQNTISYRNAQGGVLNGAYKNAIRYTNVLFFDEATDPDGHSKGPAARQNTNSRAQNDDGQPAKYERVYLESQVGPAMEAGHRNLGADNYLQVVDAVLRPGEGWPKVYVSIDDDTNPWLVHFVRSGVTPDDFEFESLSGGNDGTHILIDHEDGRKWEIIVSNGQKIVRTR